MTTRTIRVETPAGATLDATVLCSFAIPRIGQNFLVYSIAEDTRDGYARVYIAALRKHDEQLSLGGLESELDWQAAIQAFRQIVRDVTL
ncbi:hypothetical protein [Pseudomonas citronellolis]|uniref:hypothetical protein n=1 Tax=Pseudomonas citronellolis TaxID=53408 RepID=UPI0023E3F033|nr:hypothetical protein [Pseudomonas citronellolis]MDF3931955.1 hypothetical protein [Pseudomonas citronellolis]